MKKKRASVLLTSLLLSALMLTPDLGITAKAGGVGVASVIGASDEDDQDEIEKAQESAQAIQENAEKTDGAGTSYVAGYSSDLVMANVSKTLNVRTEPSDSAEKAGVLYKDCGGRILEQKDGWTKIESGDLVGWADDDYLLFGEDAKELASEVGSEVITVTTNALYVRSEASTSSDSLGVITKGDQLDIIEDLGNGWISVEYDDEEGYVQAKYVTTDFRLDAGETLAAIKLREEEAKKAEMTRQREAVQADGDEVKLLAALIQCEAGNQPYEGKVGVGAVVMNRVKSAAYPNTIYDVIYASGQFTPALNGKVAEVYNSGKISDSCMQAAQAAINGETTVGGATHFKRVGHHDGGYVIQDHVFW